MIPSKGFQLKMEHTTGVVISSVDNNSNCCPIDLFRSAMASAGLITADPIIPDGLLHRVHIESHSRGSKNGSYVLHVDSRVNGWFKDFKCGYESTWSPKGTHHRLSKEEMHAIHLEKMRRQLSWARNLSK